MASRSSPRHALFWGLSTLLFAASTVVTILWCTSLPATGGMAMHGGGVLMLHALWVFALGLGCFVVMLWSLFTRRSR